MAKAWLAGLLSELHRETLKPAGFRKEGSTFYRDREGYVERYNFQGSSWSSADLTAFYLNVGVEFADHPAAESDWMYFRRAHWACRVDKLVRGAPKDWRCGVATDRTALKAQLAALVLAASEQVAARLPELRATYLERLARQVASPDVPLRPN